MSISRQRDAGRLMIFIAAAMCGCNGDPPPAPSPFAQPGQSGDLGATRPPIVDARLEVPGLLPDVLACDSTYDLEAAATLSGEVDCTDPPYGVLHDEAIALLRSRLAEVSCHEDCPTLSSQRVYQKGECVAEVAWAKLTLRERTRCLPEGAVGPAGLELPDDPPPQFEDTLPGSLPHSVLESGTTQVGISVDVVEACPTNFFVHGRVTRSVPDCTAVTDYQPYVDLARGRALALWDRAACRSICQKVRPPEETFTSWSCAPVPPGGGALEAEAFVRVCCRDPNQTPLYDCTSAP